MKLYKRIRYDEKSVGTENFLQSKHVFMHDTDGGRYTVYLYNEASPLRYELMDIIAQKVAHEGTAVSVVMLKQAVKAKLVELGIRFEPETRTKRCEVVDVLVEQDAEKVQ